MRPGKGFSAVRAALIGWPDRLTQIPTGLRYGARLEKDPRRAGVRLLEGFWSAGLSDVLRARCDELGK
jgi:hypothetical protein